MKTIWIGSAALCGLLVVALAVNAGSPKDAVRGHTVRFKNACAAGAQLTLAVTSDILLHRPVRLSAGDNVDRRIIDPEARVAQAFSLVFHRIQRHIAQADISYTNLEGALARNCTNSRIREEGRPNCRRHTVRPDTVYDERVYTTYPRFNFPPATARTLKQIGFDVISFANNHATDRFSNGIDMTLDALTRAGLLTVGAIRYKDLVGGKFPKAKRAVLVTRKGITLGFLAYTYGTNIADETGQILNITSCLSGDCQDVLDDIRRVRKRADFVVVGLHWGQQHKPKPTPRQRVVAKLLLDAGVDLIVGGHPHRLQPWEKYRTKDGRDTLVLYSLGDLTGSWTEWINRTGAIVYIGISKPNNAPAQINGARVLPVFHYKTHYPKTGRLLYQSFPLGRKTRFKRQLQVIIENFGSGNLIEPDAPLVTNPQCKPKK